MSYLVRSFEKVSPNPGGMIVFSPQGSYSVTSPAMQAVVVDLSERRGDVLSGEDVLMLLQREHIDTNAGITFLSNELGLLSPAPPANEVATNVLVLTDLPLVGDMLVEALALPNLCDVSWRPVDGESNEDVPNPDSVVLLIGDYRPATIRKVYRTFGSHPNVTIVTSYLYRHIFAIDGVYIPTRGLPCHFCHRHRFETLENNRGDAPQSSWLAMKKFLEDDGVVVPSVLALNRAVQGMMAMHLKHEVEAIVGIEPSGVVADRLGTTLRIDLRTGERVRDKVFHWEACECLKGDWS